MKYFILENKNKFLYRREKDGGLIYLKDKGNVLFLNETGALIFEALREKKYSIDDLAEYLIKHIEEKPEKQTVVNDIKEFIENLSKLGILEKE